MFLCSSDKYAQGTSIRLNLTLHSADICRVSREVLTLAVTIFFCPYGWRESLNLVVITAPYSAFRSRYVCPVLIVLLVDVIFVPCSILR